jgi:hypothetical protein
MTIKYGDKGREVKRAQHALIALGHPLPKYGPDGDLGREGWGALEDYARESGFDLGPNEELDSDDPVDALVAGLIEKHEALLVAAPPAFPDVSYSDLTGFTGKHRRGQRPWKQVDAIVLHQTGCKMPSSPGGWHLLRAHVGIPETSERQSIYLVNPLATKMWHANGFNRRSIGIEISGNMRGIEGDNRTWWQPGKGPHPVTDAQVKAARKAIAWICSEAGRGGGKITHIFAHRQASKDRIADPGSRVWQEVGMWAMDELGLSDGGPDYKTGSGYRIPKEWCNREGYDGNSYWSH